MGNWSEKGIEILEELGNNFKIDGYDVPSWESPTYNEEEDYTEMSLIVESPKGMIHITATMEEDDLFDNKEEETMEFKVINSSKGTQPVAGYLSDIIKMVANMNVDGWDLSEFVTAISTRTDIAEKKGEADEFFFVIDSNFDDSNGTLTYTICETYDEISTEDKHGYAPNINADGDWSEKARAFRMYVDSRENWGLDEIEIPEPDEYYLVKVTISRIREVKEIKDVYVAVKKGYSDSPTNEVEEYIRTSFDGDDDDGWETEDEFYNCCTDLDIDVENVEIEEEGTLEDIDYVDIEETLE